tara:strand:- start:3141 stop:4082 length:942 start_codon:yes stop_codon:yes gene_type:complete
MKFKKPKFWDFNKPSFISYLLVIFTVPVIINNFLLSLKNKKKCQLKTICIGNIYIGGTGKTSTTIKLYNILKDLKYNVVTGKKFYKSQIDEQILLKNKTILIQAPNRKTIIKKALENRHELIIFDDGLQDKRISYDLQFVCFDGNNWIGNGQLIPAGPLREKLTSIKKYDAVFLKDFKDKNIYEILKKINPQIKIFNTFYEIKNLQSLDLNYNYLIFSGIGNPIGFKKILLNNNLNIVDELIYPDHFNYTNEEISNIKKRAENIGAKIITTEKDYVKIPCQNRDNINFCEVNLRIDNEEDLTNFIKTKINEIH